MNRLYIVVALFSISEVLATTYVPETDAVLETMQTYFLSHIHMFAWSTKPSPEIDQVIQAAIDENS